MKKTDYLNQQGFDEQEAHRIASVITKFGASPVGVMPHEKTWDEIRAEIREHNRNSFKRAY